MVQILKVFEINEKVFVSFGVCPPYESSSRFKVLVRHLFGTLLFFCGAGAAITFCVYGFKHGRSHDKETLFPMIAFLAFSSTLVCAIVMTYIQKEKLKDILKQFQHVYDNCKSPLFKRWILQKN